MKKYIDQLLNYILHILDIHLNKEKKEAFIQFIMFCIVGFSNTFISYVVYALILYFAQGLSYDYILANFAAFFLSVLWSFYWNNKIVFEDNSNAIIKKLVKMYISYSFSGLFLANITSVLFVELLGVNKYIVPLFNVLVGTPINFLINKYWTFNN